MPVAIVGVMPQEFFGLDVGRRLDVVLPLAAEPMVKGEESQLADSASWWLQIMVRLKPGQSVEQADAALRGVPELQTHQLTRTKTPEPVTVASMAGGTSSLRGRFEGPLVAMSVAVGLVLLVACANIASLVLARALVRRREISVRLALGSSRGRIARMLLMESFTIAATSAGVALVFAWWAGEFLVRQLNTWQSSVSLDLAFDWRVLSFASVLTGLTSVVASVAPLFGLKTVAPGDALRGMRGDVGNSRFSVRGTLVVVQIAISFVLVVAAGLFLRTFVSLNQLPLGFSPEPLVVAELDLQADGGAPESRLARVERLREIAAVVPGVRSAAASSVRLLSGSEWATGLLAIGDGPMERTRPFLWLNATTPAWFETMGIPIVAGRDFEPGDRAGSRPVAIVNEAFVRRHLPGTPPLGQTVRLGFDRDTPYEIVGIVGDTVYSTTRDGMAATMYVAMAQRTPSTFWESVLLTVNTVPAARQATARDVTRALRQADPGIGFTFGAFTELVDATLIEERLVAWLSAFFGGLALLLAAIGLYGLVAHAVRARQMEIGLRIALGATPVSIVRMIFRQVAALIVTGLAIGAAFSLWGARFVESLLFQLHRHDPLTFAVSAIVLLIVGVAAAWIPALRAARLDAVSALRNG